MTYARKARISLQDTSDYHVTSRCVRRAWLWGFDEYARRDYSHRKPWVLERLVQLTSIFTIEVCAFAVMQNHYHLVLHVDQPRAAKLTQEEIVARWTRIFAPPPVLERYLGGQALAAEAQLAQAIIATWRARLTDISWFMKCLNEHLARRANAEDDCTGKFWEGRFKSQALLDEAGLLTAMAYVDLNPVRAGIASTPESSAFTSIYQRIRALRPPVTPPPASEPMTSVPLRAFQPHSLDRTDSPEANTLPYRLDDYLRLLDWTGRAVRADKAAAIDAKLPPIAQRLNIDAEAWQRAMQPSGNVFGRAMGRVDHLRLHALTLGQSWIRGLLHSARLYPTA
jgi:REP element-mobilizing transposase RayT